MIHHEGKPSVSVRSALRHPADLMQQRAANAAKFEEFRHAQAAVQVGEAGSVEEYYAQQDAKKAAAETATVSVPDAVLAQPVVAEVSGDAAMFARMEGKTVEQMDPEERALHAKIMQANAERARARLISAQKRSREIVDVRAGLMKVPSAVAMTRTVERHMPEIDSRRVYQTEYGPLMVLRVDEAKGIIYFATPEERQRVDAVLMRDEAQSSLGVADFQHVLGLTVEQARQMLKSAGDVPVRATAKTAEAEYTPTRQRLPHRYGAAS